MISCSLSAPLPRHARTISSKLRVTLSAALAASVFAPAPLWAASSSWNVDANGNWITGGSWLGSSIPGSTSITNSTDIATFGLNLTADRVVTVDANRNIGGITFTGNNTNFRYTLSSGNLRLTNGGVIQVDSGATSGTHTETISSAIAIQGDGGAGTFTNNAATTRLLSIGAVTGVSTGSNVTTLTLNGTNTGNSIVNGVIGDGAGGGKLAIVKEGAGKWQIGGTNTYSGGLTIKQGTLELTAAGAGGSGAITLGDSAGGANAASLFINASVAHANPIILAGTTTGTLAVGVGSGAVTGSYSGGITGSNNVTLANGGTSTLTFSTAAINNAGTVTNAGSGSGAVIISGGVGANVTSVIQNSTTSALTVSTTALTVNSGGTTLTNAAGTKLLTVSSAISGSGNLVLNNNSALSAGVTLSGAVNHTGTITNSGTGTTTPAIIGTTTLSYDKNVLISGAVGSNVTTVTQNSVTSSMELSNANTFTGSARVFAGTLILGNATAAGASQILLGDTSGSADVSLLTRGALTIANNILVQSRSSGSSTIGSAAGGSAGSNNSPIYSGTITLNKDVTVTPFNNNLTFSGLVTGASGIAVSNTGPFLSTSGQYYGVGGGNAILSKADLTNTFGGDVKINSGALSLTGSGTTNVSLTGLLGTGTNAILIGDTSGANAARLLINAGATGQTLSRNMVVQAGSGGVAGVGVSSSNGGAFTGSLTLNKSAYFLNGNSGSPTITYSGAVTEGASAIGGTSIISSGGNVVKLTNTGNNYDGGNIAGGIGTLWGSGAGALGGGNAVAELGLIRLSDQVALANGKKVSSGPYGGISIGTNSAAQITYAASVLDSSSQGGVTLGIGLSNPINLASFGNGLMYLGSDSSGLTYSAASLGANTDGNYRLGWGRQTLTMSTGALTGASAKLIVGTSGALTPVSSGAMNNSGTVNLTATNTYGGGTEVNTGSTLQGTQRTVAGESPFGSATAAMALHNSTLQLANNGTSSIGTAVGAFSFDGNSVLRVDGVTAGGNALTVGAITRNNRGVLSIITSGTGATYGSTVFLKTSGTAPATTTAKVTGGTDVQMVAPYFIEGSSGNFLSYDATNGFVPITTGYNTTDFTGLPTNAIVRMTNQTTTLNANTTIYALGLVPAATQTITSNTSGSDKTLTISSGGLYMDGRTGSSQSATIGSNTAGSRISFDFAGQEAIINVSTSNNSGLTIAGNIINANGLTKSGNAQLTLSGTGSTFTGPITILGTTGSSTLAISSDLNLGGSGAALNNGVVLDGGKLLFANTMTMNSGRTLTIGTNGGTLTSLNSGNYGANDITIASKITGSTGGNLTIYSSMTGGANNSATSTFAFTNPANDFTAPIFVGNANLSGVMALLFDTDGQLGNSANTVTLLGGNSVLRYTGTGAISTARTINFFDLGGGLEVSSATGALTNSGVLSGSGVFNKMGAGKLVLTGSNTYTGNTIVSAGVLNVQNANALGATTAVISGNSGVSGGAAYVQSGAALEVESSGALGNAGGKTLYLNGGGISNGGALRNVSGTNSNSGAVVLQSSTTIGADAGSLTLSGSVSGTGSALTKTGAGTLVLSGANTYTGGTTITDGTLQLGAGGATGSLSTTGAIVNNGILGINRSNTVTQGTDFSASTITGTGSLALTGSGTTILNAANTYGGGTVVSAGKLVVNNTTGSGTGSGALSIGASATLGGSGFIDGATTIAGTLSPGNSPGLLTTGAQTWVNGGSYNWQVVDASGVAGTGFDSVAITSGGLNLTGLTTGGFTINLWSLSSTSPDVNGEATHFDNTTNHSWTLVSNTGDLTSIVGSAFTVNVAANNGTTGFTNDLGSGSFSVVGGVNSLELVFTVAAIPEPATYAALLGAVALAGVVWRRRRSLQP